MKHLVRYLLGISAVLAIAVYASLARAEVSVGSKAPSFSLTGADGKEYSNESLKGKVIVLEWMNYECPFIKKHYDLSHQNMQNLQSFAKEKGVVWLSVSSSGKGKQGHLTKETALEEMASHKSHATTILLDESGIVGKLFGAKTTPHMFIVDGSGVVRYSGAIDDINSTDPDDIPNAHNYVKSALEEILSHKSVSQPSTEAYGCSVKYSL